MKATSKAASKSHTKKPNARVSPKNSNHKQTDESLREYQAILATAEAVANIGSWKWDLRTQKVTWSKEMFRLFGIEPEGFDGDLDRIVAERIHPEDIAAVTEANRRVLEDGNPIPLSYRIVLPDGTERTVWAQGQLVREETGQAIALMGYIQDITKRVFAEKKIIQLKRLYATLSQVNQMIVRVKERGELFQTICDVAVQFGEFALACINILDEASGEVRPVAANGLNVQQSPLPIINLNQEEHQNSLTRAAILTSKVMISENIQTDARIYSFSNHFQGDPYGSFAVIPFRLRNKTIGTLALISKEKGLFKDEEEIRLLDEMGLDISFALDNIENEKERKQAEEALRESEERYRGLFDHMAEGYAYCEMIFENGAAQDWIYHDVNDAFETLTGLKNVKGKRVSKIIPGIYESDAELFEIYSRVALTGKHEKFETFVQALQQWFSISVYSPQKGFFVAVFDVITERKRAEEALQRSAHVLWLFVQHSPASIAMFDRDMKYIVASHRYLIDYRLGEQELNGRSHYEVFPEMPERWKEIHRRCLQGAVEKADEDPFPRQDGTVDWVRWEIRPWYEEPGKIGGLILFSEVITERKQIQDELRRLNVELEGRVQERTMELSQANRAKDEFLANMSHELRTPLNTVLGLSETLLEQRRGPLNEKQVQSIELISSSGQHLLGLINDILEVSKIEAGKLQLHPRMVSLKELCESSLNFIRELALKKSITVEFHNETSLSTLRADPQRLKQILINLLTNAVKFTPEKGKVSLEIRTDAEQNQILFSVADTGIGIATEDLKKLFKPFTQLDSSLSRHYAGTGLGLALVQKLAELHGGCVQVESEIGKGSRFTILLPLIEGAREPTSFENAVDSSEIEQAAAPTPPVLNELGIILLAEDSKINSEMLGEYLTAHGYFVVNAQNGVEVLEICKEYTPDLILMDIQMPKMDGLEATRHLRANPRFASTPIIALTALAMPGDKERCLEAGVNEYLSKPVGLKTLLRVMERLIKTEG